MSNERYAKQRHWRQAALCALHACGAADESVSEAFYTGLAAGIGCRVALPHEGQLRHQSILNWR